MSFHVWIFFKLFGLKLVHIFSFDWHVYQINKMIPQPSLLRLLLASKKPWIQTPSTLKIGLNENWIYKLGWVSIFLK